MPLAEGPSIDGGTLALVLAVLLVGGTVWLLAMVFGFQWAARARDGSRRAAVLWAASAVVALVPGLLAGPNPLLLPGVVAVGAQVAVFAARGRRR